MDSDVFPSVLTQSCEDTCDIVEDLRAENARLHEALRDHCIAQYLSTKVYECRQCGGVWGPNDEESHNNGCLAEKKG